MLHVKTLISLFGRLRISGNMQRIIIFLRPLIGCNVHAQSFSVWIKCTFIWSHETWQLKQEEHRWTANHFTFCDECESASVNGHHRAHVTILMLLDRNQSQASYICLIIVAIASLASSRREHSPLFTCKLSCLCVFIFCVVQDVGLHSVCPCFWLIGSPSVTIALCFKQTLIRPLF